MRATRTRTTHAPARRLGLAGLAAAATLAAAVIPFVSAGAETVGTTAADPITVVNSTFEDGTTGGWTPRGSEIMTVGTTAAHGGSRSLEISGRTQSWEGPVLDVAETFVKGTQYTISAWVRLAAGAASDNARLSVERRTDGVASYDQVVGNTAVTSGGWTNLTGRYTLATDVEFLTVYVETADTLGDFLIDDVTISYVPATPIQTELRAVKDAVTEFPVGAAITPPSIIAEHGQLLAKHFNSVTPGNALKWDATQPTEGTFRFTDADAMVDFAQANGMAVRDRKSVV